MDRPRIALPALVLLSSLLFFCRLRTPLLEPEEARYAEIPRQMLHADRWIVPLLHGQDYLDKPPLFYWMVMGSYRLFGVHDWSARLVAGLVGVLTVAVVYGWAWRTLGSRYALAAGLVLCLMPEFVYRGRMVTPNGLLALWTTAALAAGDIARRFYALPSWGGGLGWGVREPASDRSTPHPNPPPQGGRGKIQWGWWVVGGVLTGLGLLTKGPVAAALVVPPLLAAGWIDRRLVRVGLLGWASFFAAAIAVAAPWFVAISCRCPQFAGYFFWFHNVVRFAAPFDHIKPIWFYMPQLALGVLPWPLLLIAPTRRPFPRAIGFALAAALWSVLFFSLAGSKRPVYLLPVLPPLALGLGCCIERVGRVRFLALGAATFVALWIGTHEWLPAYANGFSLKQVVRAAELSPDIFCYPQPMDAVSFYLRRNDIRYFTAADRMIAELGRQPDALVFVKTTHLKELLAALPADVDFETVTTAAGVAVGRLRPRRQAAALPPAPCAVQCE
jgi:4-amino-4-deoxy-L-arabinose transferase-like glycosyltransferase